MCTKQREMLASGHIKIRAIVGERLDVSKVGDVMQM